MPCPSIISIVCNPFGLVQEFGDNFRHTRSVLRVTFSRAHLSLESGQAIHRAAI
jgi:hypothetical protein